MFEIGDFRCFSEKQCFVLEDHPTGEFSMYVHSVLRVLINTYMHARGGGINVHTESRRTWILEIVGWKMGCAWIL